VRANTLRATRDELAAALAVERPAARVTPSARVPEALRVDGGGDPATTRAFAEGRLAVQDLAAQEVARLVAPEPGWTLLDACAGVGGKSTHLAALAGDRARIDAADRSERKLELCAESARRLGVSSLRTIVSDLSKPGTTIAASYDAVLLDAPCSGLGVLRRHPEAKWRRSDERARASTSPSAHGRLDTGGLVALQAALLEALAPRARRVLVYSVCTFTDEEGPAQIERFLAAHPELARDGEPLVTWPHRDDADAFFAVRLVRR
jgi:16S rRNA (cytosine967-C5)-methyltransferase